jgi:hypothetical protein
MVRFRIGLILLAALFAVQGERAVVANGPTFDEAAHYAAGYSYWHTGDFRLNVEDPPLAKLLWTLPQFLFDPIPFEPDATEWTESREWAIGNRVLFDSGRSWESLLRSARRINLLFGIGVVLLVGSWSRQLTGDPRAGLVAAACAAFDPNLVAHSAILSTDTAMTFATLLTMFAAWRYLREPTAGRLNAVGIAFGLALGAKFSAVALIPAMAVGLLAVAAYGRTRPQALFGPIVRVVTLALIVVALLYYVVELPAWGRGLKYQLVREQFNSASFYFRGEVRSEGWWLYFPAAILWKMPLGTLFLAGVGLLVRRPRLEPATAFVVATMVLFFLALIAANVNLGIRIVLPALPFVYLLAGRAIADATWPRASAIGATLVWATWAGVSSSPYPLTYFNESVANPTQQLGDSNLDWGQGLPALKEYLDREQPGTIYLSYCGTAPPEAFGIRCELLPGYGRIGPSTKECVPENAARILFAIGVGNLQGTYLHPPELYRWLDAYTPVAKLAGCIWIYDFTDDPSARARLRAIAGAQ